MSEKRSSAARQPKATPTPQLPRAKRAAKSSADPLVDSQESATKEQVSDPMQTESKPPEIWQSRPAKPYEAGNLESVRHGGYSSTIVATRARSIEVEIIGNAPHLDVPEYRIAVTLLASAVARSRMFSEHIETVGIAKAGPRMLEQATATENVASKLAGQLGLDPRSFVELRAIGSLADVTEAQFSRIAPAVPLAIATALKQLGLEDRTDEFNAAFVQALRGPQ